MYRTALRTASRPVLRSLRAQQSGSQRFASTSSPVNRPRSWKNSALRWGVAGGVLYYYTTSSVFADEVAPQTVSAPPSFVESDLPTVDSVLEEKRKQIQSKIEKHTPGVTPEPIDPATTRPQSSQGAQPQHADEADAAQGAGALEEEAGQEGAFNPETGEINWDCACLGGMAHGPCGEEFKTAFSCFVYSTEEPKGMDCIEKFQGMQDCFRQYPEIYGAELADDEADGEGAPIEGAASEGEPPLEESQQLRDLPPAAVHSAKDIKTETDDLPSAAPVNTQVPAKWDDATAANHESKDDGEQRDGKEEKQ